MDTFSGVSHEASEFEACAVCGRTILRGERVAEYRTRDGELVGVCELCKDVAEDMGWLPAELVVPEAEDSGPGRTAMLRSRLARAGERAAERVQAVREAAVERRAPPPEPAPRPEPPRLDEGPRTPERLLRLALEFFNATEEPRKVAGLSRSLGEPLVSARADLDAGRVELTVAWELSWYRWEVAADGRVRELAHGDELDELEDGERNWNATVSEDGRLRLKATG